MSINPSASDKSPEKGNLSPYEAVSTKSGDFHRWLSGDDPDHGASIEEIKTKCPKCKGTVVCAYAEMGAVDYYHTFAHVCLNPDCDYCEETTQFEGNYGGGPAITAPTYCPLCGRLVSYF